MQKSANNPAFKYLLILCLGISLLLAQTNNLHMHLQHDDHSSITSGHDAINIHTASMPHDYDQINQYIDHHSGAIEFSADNLLKNKNLFNPLLLIFLFTGLYLFLSHRIYTYKHRRDKILLTPCYYLLRPPLRAPPL